MNDIYSRFYDILLQDHAIYIKIYNPYGRLQIKCAKGRETGEECQQRLFQTQLWTVVDVLCYKLVFAPVLECTLHKRKNISYLYGYKNEDERLTLGPGDIIEPPFKLWTLVPWKTTQKGLNWRSNRYHFSDGALEFMTDCLFSQSFVHAINQLPIS